MRYQWIEPLDTVKEILGIVPRKPFPACGRCRFFVGCIYSVRQVSGIGFTKVKAWADGRRHWPGFIFDNRLSRRSKDNFEESILSFYHLEFRDPRQDFSLGSR